MGRALLRGRITLNHDTRRIISDDINVERSQPGDVALVAIVAGLGGWVRVRNDRGNAWSACHTGSPVTQAADPRPPVPAPRTH